MQEKISEICRELCGREVAPKEQLILSGLLDSYKIMELLCRLEEEFQIAFTPEEIVNLEHLSCVERIAELVDSKLSH